MLFLWIFGNNIEDKLGQARLRPSTCSAGSWPLPPIARHPNSTVPVVGASGAVAAVMGAYLVWFPRARSGRSSSSSCVRCPPRWLLGFWFVLQFFTGPDEGVAWMAHVGGFAFGVVVGSSLRGRMTKRPAAYGSPDGPLDARLPPLRGPHERPADSPAVGTEGSEIGRLSPGDELGFPASRTTGLRACAAEPAGDQVRRSPPRPPARVDRQIGLARDPAEHQGEAVAERSRRSGRRCQDGRPRRFPRRPRRPGRGRPSGGRACRRPRGGARRVRDGAASDPPPGIGPSGVG